ncbi:hypothetical protein ACO0RG_003034 [Hanseniaspora osmophila]|uniref:Swiss Army Knife RNA repair protein HAD domain-containing protein n=1 Tax=Hanseniaspora osmophila TaxID=56408 RepID=A0A1E5RE38_9ASCO|nr:Uncharacterized protein AWRI3579_g1687 [Hanseniaspora osmophila]
MHKRRKLQTLKGKPEDQETKSFLQINLTMSPAEVIEKYHSLPNVEPKTLVDPKKIKTINIFDFDNTLFNSPAPNPHIIEPYSLNVLSYPYHLHTGGWWCQPSYLNALVDEWLEDRRHLEKSGIECSVKHNYQDEQCQCDECKIDRKYWNPHTCRLLHESSLQEDNTLTLIMTGRRNDRFAPVMEKVFANTIFKRRIHVNGVFLKDPTFSSTMAYKTQVLSDLLLTFKPQLLVMYDDRPSQIKGFKSFLYDFRRSNESKLPYFRYEVVLVPRLVRYLSAYKERLLLEQEIKEHNEISQKQALHDRLNNSNGSSSLDDEAGKLHEIQFDQLQIVDKNIKAYHFLQPLYKKKLVSKTKELLQEKFPESELSFNENELVFEPIGIRLHNESREEFSKHIMLLDAYTTKHDVPNPSKLQLLTDSSNAFYTTGYEEPIEWTLTKLNVAKDMNYIYYTCEPVTPNLATELQPAVPGLIVAYKKKYVESLNNNDIMLSEEDTAKKENYTVIDLNSSDLSNTIITHFGYKFEIHVDETPEKKSVQ